VRAGLPPVAVQIVSAPTVTTLINKGLLFGHVVDSISTGMRCVAANHGFSSFPLCRDLVCGLPRLLSRKLAAQRERQARRAAGRFVVSEAEPQEVLVHTLERPTGGS
jgi:hypothetical protein